MLFEEPENILSFVPKTSIKNESPLIDDNIKITKDIIVKNFCRKFNFDLRFDQNPKLF